MYRQSVVLPHARVVTAADLGAAAPTSVETTLPL